MPSAFLTLAFMGRRYVFVFASGNTEVVQVVFPVVTLTGTDPNAILQSFDAPRICSDTCWGTPTKYHAAPPPYFQTEALNEKV